MDPEKLKRMQEKQRLKKQESYKRYLINQKEKNPYLKLNEFMQELRFSNRSGSHINCFRVGINNTWFHEFRKFQVFWALRKQRHDVMTEAIFTNDKRADVIDMTDGIVYEVTFTETKEELAEKVKNYPEVFEVRQVDATKEFEEKMLL